MIWGFVRPFSSLDPFRNVHGRFLGSCQVDHVGERAVWQLDSPHLRIFGVALDLQRPPLADEQGSNAVAPSRAPWRYIRRGLTHFPILCVMSSP
jgi:hypothetical protein